jgi:RNA polymerase sigma factor (sigma-70 family)
LSTLSDRSWSNARLVEECLRGNESAWRILVDRYKNLIYSIPLRYGAPPQDAADIFQAVCLDLFHELPRLRDANALQGWLIRVTAHKCYHWQRQRTVHGETWDSPEDEHQIADPALPTDWITSIEREQLVHEAMEELPARCRELIRLLFFEHPPIPYSEVAGRLGLARGSIGFVRGRCLKRLKKILTAKGF